jgi:NADH-quinone oxidoreductase subunit N
VDDLHRFGPELSLLIAAGLIVIIDALIPIAAGTRERRTAIAAGLALLGIAVSAGWSLVILLNDDQGPAFDGLMVVDDYSLFFNFLFAGVAAMIVLASIDFLEKIRFPAEYIALVLAATVGMMLMASSVDLIAIFVALELQAIAFYVLVGFMKDKTSSEAALKYLVAGAISTAVTLYGIADFVDTAGPDARSGLVLAAAFLAAGLGFKMAVVPFQMWVPDVYQGAPTPVTAFLSVASKAAGFAVVMRIFVVSLGQGLISSDWSNMFAAIAAISMTLGNVTALVQTNIKRMLGYSSIAQAGTFLIGLAAVAAQDPHQAPLGTSTVLFFLGTYAFTNLGAFAAIIAISNKIGSDEIDDYAGVAKRSPWLAAALAICLFSLTGIPPTAGFWAKVYVFDAAVSADLVWLAMIGVLNSVISAYYYLRVVMKMYAEEPETSESFQTSPFLGIAIAAAVIGLLAVGFYPDPLLQASESAAAVFA